MLVVGAAASGMQIADELLRAGRRVSIAVGEHVRVPRRYRGRGHPLVDGGGRRPRRALRRDGRPRPRPQPALDAARRDAGGRDARPERAHRAGRDAARPARRRPRRAAALLGIAAERVPAGRPEAGPAAGHARRLGRGERASRSPGRRSASRRPRSRTPRRSRSTWTRGGDPDDPLGHRLQARPLVARAPGAQPARAADPRRRRDPLPRALPHGDAVPAPAQVDPHRRRRRPTRATSPRTWRPTSRRSPGSGGWRPPPRPRGRWRPGPWRPSPRPRGWRCRRRPGGAAR